MSTGAEPGPRPTTAALAQAAAWPEAQARPQVATAPRSAVLSRIGWGAFLLPALAVLITAAFLTPNPVGHGTHTQLGLPPCGFYLFTGVPCPGCGLTTCFSFMMRLDVVGAAQANPFGVMLWMTTVAVVPLSVLGLLRGWPVVDTLDRLHADKWAILLSACSILVFAVRAATILL